MVIHLIEGPGRQPEGQTAQGVFNPARAIQGVKSISQHGVALAGVLRQHQCGKAGNGFQPVDQSLRLGNGAAVHHQAYQNLPAGRSPADIDVPQQAGMSGLVVDGNMKSVYIIDYRVLHGVGFLRKNPAAGIFHHLVGARPEEPGEGPAFLLGDRILGFVPVAQAGGGRQNGHRIQILSGQPVQAVRDPLGFQPGFLGIVHVPEIAASAQLGHGALPVPAMRGFFQDLHNFAGSPGFLGLFNPQAHPFPGNGVGDKHRTAFNVGNPLTLGGIVGDEGFVNLVFNEHGFLRLTGCTPFRFSGASAHTFRRISGRFHCRTTHSM